MSDQATAWIEVYHQRGLKVRLPIPLTETVTAETWGRVVASIDAALQAGLLASAPGAEPGEEKEMIGWVCRLDHYDKKEGKTTPTVLVYSTNEQLTYSFLRKYLNNADEIAAFEKASGVTLASLPVYPGNDHPQRGSSPQTAQYIVKIQPFGVIWKPNPSFKPAPAGDDTRSLGEKRKRDFVRWESQSRAAVAATPVADARSSQQSQHAPAQPPMPSAPPADKDVARWQSFLGLKPSAADLTATINEDFMRIQGPARVAVWGMIGAYRKERGWGYDEKRRAVIDPTAAPPPAVGQENIPF